MVVVGGGISGLAAARVLINNGYRVTLLEANDRLGGRIWTDKTLFSYGGVGMSEQFILKFLKPDQNTVVFSSNFNAMIYYWL